MKVNKFIYSIEKIALIILMYGLVAVLFVNVVYRFVLFIPSAWADELSRFMFTWTVMLGASTAMYKWEHIDINLIDTIVAKFTKADAAKCDRIIGYIKKFAIVVSIIYLIALFVVYGQYLQQINELGTMSMFLGCSLLVPMSAIYVCSGLMVSHGICYLIIPDSIKEQEG